MKSRTPLPCPARAGRRFGLLLGGPLLAAILGVAGCVPPAPPLPTALSRSASQTADGEIVATLFLLGDPGDAVPGRSPVLTALGDEVRSTARTGHRTVVAFLGDLVYPAGVRPPTHTDHPRDTLILRSQLEVLLDESGSSSGAEGWFIPGNHDWGGYGGERGRARLFEMERVVDRWSDAGYPVQLMPRGGSLDAVALQLTPEHRLLALDTQGWLMASREEVAAAGTRLAAQLQSAETAPTVVLAHHPLRGRADYSALSALTGPRGVLSRAGALIQDPPSAPYQRMVDAIDHAFREGPRPLLYAAGHDHTLQLFDHRHRDSGALWELVAGSGSKRSSLQPGPDLVLGGSWPGYARLDLLSGGDALLTLRAGPTSALLCGESSAPELRRCMEEGVDAFRTIFSQRLTPRSGL